jgi:UDP-2,3-diacylglucosamine pyrophosphatase LpxH
MQVLDDQIDWQCNNNQIGSHLKNFEEMSATFAHQCLNDLFSNSVEINFEKKTPLVFFSDCHRGNGGKTDLFAPNETLYYHALQYYQKNGYTYFEVGDGDEMYKHSFRDIQNNYIRIFDMLHQLDRKQKLILITGNHDLGITKNEKLDKGGLLSREGVIIDHADYDQQIIVAHGHQADILSQSFRPFARLVVRYLVDPLIKMGVVSFDNRGEACLISNKPFPKWLSAYIHFSQEKIEKRLLSWINSKQRAIICGHTHNFKALSNGVSSYFNTGSCLTPNRLTGFELINGSIHKVIWTTKRPARGGARQIKRELFPTVSNQFRYNVI